MASKKKMSSSKEAAVTAANSKKMATARLAPGKKLDNTVDGNKSMGTGNGAGKKKAQPKTFVSSSKMKKPSK